MGALPVDVSTALSLTFVPATQALATPVLTVGHVLEWWGSPVAVTGDATVTVIRSPGELAVTGPAVWAFTVGTPSVIAWTVQHISGPQLHGIEVTVSPPVGLVLEESATHPGDGWDCSSRRRRQRSRA
jgi:hypothetical protein